MTAETNILAGPSSRAEGAPAASPGVWRGLSLIPRGVILGLAPLAAVCAIGAPYYALPLGERLWHPLHPWFRPSGYIGQSAGFVAFALFSFLWLYPLRKRLPALSFAGPMSRWLDLHIIAGILVPLVGAIHSAFRFTGLIGIGYMAMLLVAMSGVIGRYLYVRVPRARDGLALDREATASRRRELVGEIVAATGMSSDRILTLLSPTPASSGGPIHTLAQMMRDDFERRRAVRGLLRDWRRGAIDRTPAPKELRRITALARREMAVAQQVRMLDATNRIFRHWHAAHQPFAVTAFLAIAVHVAVVISLHTTWIW